MAHGTQVESGSNCSTTVRFAQRGWRYVVGSRWLPLRGAQTAQRLPSARDSLLTGARCGRRW